MSILAQKTDKKAKKKAFLGVQSGICLFTYRIIFTKPFLTHLYRFIPKKGFHVGKIGEKYKEILLLANK